MSTLPSDDAELSADAPASERISRQIRQLNDWRGVALGQVRSLIREADPSAVEAWKWSGTPVWEHGGVICTGEVYRALVRITFAQGANLEDPTGLFNGALQADSRRAIDITEAAVINPEAFVALVKAAVSLNTGR